ncbi:MAG TPA: hypothetical protein VGL38_04720 [bacterium]|jgi:hypothetical protein
MKKSPRLTDPNLLEFWRTYAAPGRIGLIHINFVAAKLINWGEKWVTPTGEPSPWTHVFMFTKPRRGMPWIAESDFHVPLPGFLPKPDGPQENPVQKWSSTTIDRAAVVDTGLTHEQFEAAEHAAQHLMSSGYSYRFAELAEAWVAMLKHDLTYVSPLHRDDSMHCGHFLRECLSAAACDPFGPGVLPHNTVPELFAQKFSHIAEWSKPQTAE